MASRRRVAWTPEARRTLDEVLDFIALDSIDGARRVLEQVLAAARSLETLADRGRVVPELEDSSIREVFLYRYRPIQQPAPKSPKATPAWPEIVKGVVNPMAGFFGAA